MGSKMERFIVENSHKSVDVNLDVNSVLMNDNNKNYIFLVSTGWDDYIGFVYIRAITSQSLIYTNTILSFVKNSINRTFFYISKVYLEFYLTGLLKRDNE